MNDTGWHTEQDAPPIQFPLRYQLYYEDVHPCRYFLSVNGDEPQKIGSHELSVQSRFRNWLLDHHYKPPQSERDVHKFEQMIERMFDTAIKRDDPAPFLQTNAGYIETLMQYFDLRIPNDLRRYGQEFLDGKQGDDVRVRTDIARIYFKWRPMKSFFQRALHLREKEFEELKLFVDAKGGYQGEKGARDWFRWTYWVPLDVFDKQTLGRWLGEDTQEKKE